MSLVHITMAAAALSGFESAVATGEQLVSDAEAALDLKQSAEKVYHHLTTPVRKRKSRTVHTAQKRVRARSPRRTTTQRVTSRSAKGKTAGSFMPRRYSRKRGRFSKRRSSRVKRSRRVSRTVRSRNRRTNQRLHGYHTGTSRKYGKTFLTNRALMKHRFYKTDEWDHDATNTTTRNNSPFIKQSDSSANIFGYLYKIQMNSPHVPLNDSFTGADTASGQPTLNTAATTRQAEWVEKLAKFYKQFRVYKFRCTIKVHNRPAGGDTQVCPVYIGMQAVDSSSTTNQETPTNLTGLKQRRIPYMLVQPGQTRTLSIEYGIHQVERMNKILWKADDGYIGSSNLSTTVTAPTKKPYLWIFAIQQADSNRYQAADFIRSEITCTYKTLWWDLDDEIQMDTTGDPII